MYITRHADIHDVGNKLEGNQVHGVRAHRKYDLACITKLVTDYIYTRLSGGHLILVDSY